MEKKGVGDRVFRRDIEDLEERLDVVEDEGGGGGGGSSLTVQDETTSVPKVSVIQVGAGLRVALEEEEENEEGKVEIEGAPNLSVQGDEGVWQGEVSVLKFVGATVFAPEGNLVRVAVIGQSRFRYGGGEVSEDPGEDLEYGQLELNPEVDVQGVFEAHVSVATDSAEDEVVQIVMKGATGAPGEGEILASTWVTVPQDKMVVANLSMLVLEGLHIVDVLALNPADSGFNISTLSDGEEGAVNWGIAKII